MVARLSCRSCEAPLPERGARCRVCGWAVDYDPKTTRQERDVILGISLMVVGLVLAIIVLSLGIVYLTPHQ
jgi:ribosomal protein L40E